MGGPGARVLIGRDTRESGPELEDALVEGIVTAGGRRVRAGVIPTPGVAVLARRARPTLGCVISASHNPYQDNGIKFLGGDGRKLADDGEAPVERLVGPRRRRRRRDGASSRAPRSEYVALAGRDLRRRRLVAGGVRSARLRQRRRLSRPPRRCFERLGEPMPIDRRRAGRAQHQRRGRLDPSRGRRRCGARSRARPAGIAFDGDADRCLAVDAAGRPVNGDAIIAAIALAAAASTRVVVTSMTNLGFHRVMRDHGIAVEVTDVGDRYVLERMLATGATLGGEQSGHVVDLAHHTTGDGLATALMLLAALGRLGMSWRGRPT